jgi:hypothetical protein
MKLGLECIISVTSSTIIPHAGAQVSIDVYKSVKSAIGSCIIPKPSGFFIVWMIASQGQTSIFAGCISHRATAIRTAKFWKSVWVECQRTNWSLDQIDTRGAHWFTIGQSIACPRSEEEIRTHSCLAIAAVVNSYPAN